MNNLFGYRHSLGRRFTMTAIMMLIPMIILVLLQYSVFNNTVSHFNLVIDHSLNESGNIRRIQNNIHLAIMAPNDYVMHGDKNEQHIYMELANEVSRELDSLGRYIQKHGHEEEYLLIRQAVEDWQQVDKKARSLLGHRNPTGNRRLAAETEILDSMTNKVLHGLEQLHEAVVLEAKQQVDQAHDLQHVMIGLIFGGMAVSAILMFWLNTILARSVVGPICCIKSAASKVGDGRLDTRLNWKRQDEIGGLSRSFDQMTEQLQTTHAELERLSRKDSLTGILNRREFDRLYKKEFSRAERYNKNLAIIIIDLDHFKGVNDQYGHHVGDNVLQKFVTVIEDAIRNVDVFARFGGEEFVLMLPENDAAQAMALATRLCGLVRLAEFTDQRGNQFKITLSAGVASYPEYENSERGLMIAADQALYRAKRNGRNRAEYPRQNIKIFNT